MLATGYTQYEYDNCLCIRQYNEGAFIYLLLHVHDMLIAARSKQEVQSLKARLSKEFDIKDLDEAKKILGMEIY